MTYKLINPPEDKRSKDIWLQHVAGFVIFQDMRNYAINRIASDVDENMRKTIVKAIDDTIYGLMMIMDGVAGILQNEEYAVRIETKILLEKNKRLLHEINTLNGDGMCMGFHGWKDGDFGEDNIYTVENNEE